MLDLLLKDKLRELRSDHDLTQLQVGRYLNMTRPGYAHYEQGTRDPSYHILLKLSKLYQIDISNLINSDTTPIDETILREQESFIINKLQRDPAKTNASTIALASINKKHKRLYKKLSDLDKEEINKIMEHKIKEYKVKKNEES